MCTLLAHSAVVHTDETSWSIQCVGDKLTLLEPTNAEYRQLTDQLLEIYRAACRVQRDRRLSEAGRQRKVAELDDQILELSGPMWAAKLASWLFGLVHRT